MPAVMGVVGGLVSGAASMWIKDGFDESRKRARAKEALWHACAIGVEMSWRDAKTIFEMRKAIERGAALTLTANPPPVVASIAERLADLDPINAAAYLELSQRVAQVASRGETMKAELLRVAALSSSARFEQRGVTEREALESARCASWLVEAHLKVLRIVRRSAGDEAAADRVVSDAEEAAKELAELISEWDATFAKRLVEASRLEELMLTSSSP